MCLKLNRKNGWAGRIRTCACQDQNLVPYRLATAQQNNYIVALNFIKGAVYKKHSTGEILTPLATKPFHLSGSFVKISSAIC